MPSSSLSPEWPRPFTHERFPAPSKNLMLEFPAAGVNRRKSAVFCENLRLGSLCHLSSVPLPKEPSCTKFSTETKFGTGREIRYGASKTLRRVLRNACSSEEKSLKNCAECKNYGGSKVLQLRAPYSVFSTGGSFGQARPEEMAHLPISGLLAQDALLATAAGC